MSVHPSPAEPVTDRHAQGAQRPPVTPTERAIADIWVQVLGLPAVGVLDNFFDLGGHSVLIHMVHDGIAQRLGKNPPVVELFKYPTIRALAGYLDGSTSAGGRPTAAAAAERRTGGARLGRKLAQRRRPPVHDPDPR